MSVPRTLLVRWPRTCNRISRGPQMSPKTADTIFLSPRRGVPNPPNKGVQ
jgi:hypothetical protein